MAETRLLGPEAKQASGTAQIRPACWIFRSSASAPPGVLPLDQVAGDIGRLPEGHRIPGWGRAPGQPALLPGAAALTPDG